MSYNISYIMFFSSINLLVYINNETQPDLGPAILERQGDRSDLWNQNPKLLERKQQRNTNSEDANDGRFLGGQDVESPMKFQFWWANVDRVKNGTHCVCVFFLSLFGGGNVLFCFKILVYNIHGVNDPKCYRDG